MRLFPVLAVFSYWFSHFFSSVKSTLGSNTLLSTLQTSQIQDCLAGLKQKEVLVSQAVFPLSLHSDGTASAELVMCFMGSYWSQASKEALWVVHTLCFHKQSQDPSGSQVSREEVSWQYHNSSPSHSEMTGMSQPRHFLCCSATSIF
jgi:hypothetical protein